MTSSSLLFPQPNAEFSTGVFVLDVGRLHEGGDGIAVSDWCTDYSSDGSAENEVCCGDIGWWDWFADDAVLLGGRWVCWGVFLAHLYRCDVE